MTGTPQVFSIVGREHDIDNDEKNISIFFFRPLQTFFTVNLIFSGQILQKH